MASGHFKSRTWRAAQSRNAYGRSLARISWSWRSNRVLARDYNKSDEEAAYAIGSAALVPYAALRKLVLGGRTADEIARRFRVSRQLVEYRIKVTHLWSAYKNLSGSRNQHV